MPEKRFISKKELAEYWGVKPPYISKLIAQKKIFPEPDGTMDWRKAEEDRDFYADPRKAKKDLEDPTEIPIYADAIARKVMAEAQLAELKLSRERGEVIAVEEAKKAISDAISRARARLLAIPTKVAPQTMACKNTAEAQTLIQKAVYEALDELAHTEDDISVD